MGLTIHFHLRSRKRNLDAVRRQLVEVMRACRDLPLENVGIPEALTGTEIRDCINGRDVHRFIQEATTQQERLIASNITTIQRRPNIHRDIFPEEMIWLLVKTLPGCEDFSLKLAKYPAKVGVTYSVGRSIRPQLRRKMVPTHLGAWQGSDFCKTQYAANDRYGGLLNFLACHLSVIKVLEECQRAGFVVQVHDELGLWEHRDIAKASLNVMAESEPLTQEGLDRLRRMFRNYGLSKVPELDPQNFTTATSYERLLLAYNYKNQPPPSTTEDRAHRRIKIRAPQGCGDPDDKKEQP